jgi:hypothetical protein
MGRRPSIFYRTFIYGIAQRREAVFLFVVSVDCLLRRSKRQLFKAAE